MKSRIDLNCDLGEGEPLQRTRALMRYITSANIACGGHAGDVRSMERAVRLAIQHGVRIGAHPGVRTHNFGRGQVSISEDELRLLLLRQVSALATIAANHSVGLHHIKFHGGLYHAVENDAKLAMAYIRFVRKYWPGTVIYAFSGGAVARVAHSIGVEIWEEGFADRAYDDDCSLVPRSKAGALLTSIKEVIRQVDSIVNGEAQSISGKRLRLNCRTICIHSDTPGAVELARDVSKFLRKNAL